MAARPDDTDGPATAAAGDQPDRATQGDTAETGFRFVTAYTLDTTPSDADGRVFSPSTGRNAEVVAEALAGVVTGLKGPLVEIGSGTGEHAAAAIGRLPGITWQPTDQETLHFPSIEAWARHASSGRIATPITLDASITASQPWHRLASIAALGPLAAVFAANVIHIAPWPVAEGIIAGAGRALAPGGRLILYGPFREGGAHTGEGNARFDLALRQRDPSHGVRDLEEVAALAATAGMGPPEIIRMPANNLTVAFTRL
ncbi:MAG: DUF938 domain-containing protein [Pseudomonadota bacterium]